MRSLLSLILVLLCATATAQTVTIPSQSACITLPAQTGCVTLPSQTVPVSGGTVTPPPTVTCTPPQVLVNGVCTTPIVTGVKWMYLNGVQTLAGDFTGSGETTNYQNVTTSGYNGGTRDILITSSVPWGYYIPYWASNYKLINPGYTYLVLSLKPSLTADTFGIHAERVGDAPLPGIELITTSGGSYGPAAVAGKWGSYKIPLKDLGVYGDATLYKVVMATHTAAADKWELDAIGFQ